MIRDLNNMYESWKSRGFKKINGNKSLRKESIYFVNHHSTEELAKVLKMNENITHEDAVLSLEIKYLDWLRGIW